jgi:hypothetical protein
LKGVATISLGLSCMFASAQGPSETLYVTANGGSNLVLVKGASETFRYTEFGDEGPIAVDGSIATTGALFGQNGGNYDLKGNYTGGFYPSNIIGFAEDATTDGRFNYEIDGGGTVYSTDRTYQSLTPLFWAGPNATGISYDANNNGLWVDVGGFMTEFTSAGNTIQGFQTTLSGYTALAFDRATDELWAGTNTGGTSLLSAFTPNGTEHGDFFLGSVTDIEGMEFNEAAITPEPQSFLPLGLGVAVFIRRRRVRQNSLNSSLRFSRNGG